MKYENFIKQNKFNEIYAQERLLEINELCCMIWDDRVDIHSMKEKLFFHALWLGILRYDQPSVLKRLIKIDENSLRCRQKKHKRIRGNYERK